MPINYSDEPGAASIGDTNVQQATTNQLDQLAIGAGDAGGDASPQRSLAQGNNNYAPSSTTNTAAANANATSAPSTTTA